MGKNLVTGRVMQLPNDTSKNSTSPHLAKNEQSLIKLSGNSKRDVKDFPFGLGAGIITLFQFM